jgi:hypothetical protein
MTASRVTKFVLAAPLVAWTLLSGGQVHTQDAVTPVNDGPNPYRTIRNCAGSSFPHNQSH